MGNTLLLIMLVASSMEMALCFGCCMVLLQFRQQTWDLPRRMLAFLTLFWGLMAFYRVYDIVSSPLQNGFTELIPPFNVFMVLCTQAFIYFYPRTLMKPSWMSRDSIGLYAIVTPLVLLGATYLFFIGRWTQVISFGEIVDNMGRADVLLRVITVDLMIPYSILYIFLPYNWRQSGATHKWIVIYSIGALSFCLLHIAHFFTGYIPLRIIQQAWEMAFIIITCNFELRDRLIAQNTAQPREAPGAEPDEDAVDRKGFWGDAALWTRVTSLLEKEEVWRNPDLSLPLMAQFCGTNTTYLSQSIKDNTGMGFNAYINKLRIQCITDRLRENPRQDIQQLCYDAGYRSRITAWRNFKEITGVTPTEYRQSLE